MQGFLTKRSIHEEKAANARNNLRYDDPVRSEYEMQRFHERRLGHRVAGYEPIQIPVNQIGFDHQGLKFVGIKERHQQEYNPSFVGKASEIKHRKVKEYVLILDERATEQLKFAIDDSEVFREELHEIREYRDAFISDERARNNNPSLQKAWDNYQTIKKLLK